MAITKNAGSIFLAAANPRLLTSPNAAIILTASAPLFHVDTGGTPDISSIVFAAQLILLEGTVTYTCTGGTLSSVANNSATLLYANMTGNVATITATLTYRGITFSTSTKITKVIDSSGTNGLNNAVVYAYQRSATAPTASPGDIVYDFAVAGITFPTTLANGWLKTFPSGSLPLYITACSASSSAATDSIASSEWSAPVVLAQNGTQGLSVATVYIYQRTATNSAPPLPGMSTVFTFSPAGLTGLTNGWATTVPDASGGGYLWVSTATASNTTATDTILSSEWAAAQILSQDGTGVGSPGVNGNSVAQVNLYQWSTVIPSNPAGTATFTWASGATTAYSASDGWTISAPANPGTPGIKLFIASVPVTAPAGTASSTATFASATIVAYSQNGAAGTQGIPGIKTATVSAYQWGLSAPTTTGTATYNWLTGTYNTPPSTGWTAAKGNAPGSGYTLYEASVRLVESSGANTSSVDWTTASIAGIAYQGTSGGAGSQGASARRAYVLIDGNTLALSPTTYTASGQALPATGTWGETRAWQATPPTPAAGQTVFQTDGIFDPVPNQTVWNVPYLSQLKVGSLSAISANLGAVTAGSIDLGSGSLSWHVDSSGNMWSGASTYAAAPYRVSSAGDVIMKSLLVQTPGGTTILDTSGLKSGFEAPGTKNSDVTLGTLGQRTFRIVAMGNYGGGAVPVTPGLYLAGTAVYASAGTYNLAVIRRSDGAIIGHDTYDVAGSGATTGGRTAATLAADLNFYGPAYIVVVWSSTEPQARRFDSALDTAMYRCGASRAVYGSAQFKLHSAYVLVGIPGCGEGNGQEAYQGTVDSDPNAWCDVGFSVVNGVLSGVSGASAASAFANIAINDATTGLNSRLRNNADQALGGIISVNAVTAPAGFRAGTLTWDNTGARTGGYGVAMTPLGLVGYKSDGTLMFSLSGSGLAVKGDISGSTGTFGAVTIGSTMSMGQTAYDTGTGAWFQGGSTPKMSMKTTSGKKFLCDPANNVLEFNGGTIDGTATSTVVSGAAAGSTAQTTLASPITGAGSGSSMADQNKSTAGTLIQFDPRTAVGTGGIGPYQYYWSLAGDVRGEEDPTYGNYIYSGQGTNTVVVRATAPSGALPSYGTIVTCTISDLGSGRVGYETFSANATFI